MIISFLKKHLCDFFFFNENQDFLTFFQPLSVLDWELHVHFKVHGQGQDLFGDGIAIWYTKERMQTGEMKPIQVD